MSLFMDEEPVIIAWRCPVCMMLFDHAGPCAFCAEFLKPLVEQIPE